MLKSFLTVTLSAAAIAIGSGAAFAQTGGSQPDRGSPGTGTMESSPSSPGGATGGAMEKSAPTKDLVGKDIVNPAGETIGEVKAVEGNQLIVGVGGFLGIGERDVALEWDQVSMTGTGKDAKLTTNMTKDQLKALPEHKIERGPAGGSMGGSGGGGAGSGGSGGGGGE